MIDTMVCTVERIVVNEKDLLDYFIAFGPLAVGIITIIIMCIANCISKRGIKQQNKQFLLQLRQEQRNLNQQLDLQRKQWLYDVYIQREAKIILEFRDALYNAQHSINWFLFTLMSPLRFQKMTPDQDVTPKPEQLVIKRKTYLKHFEMLNRLNNLYNANQIIFRKYKMEDAIYYINAILDSDVFLKNQDMHYRLVKKDNMGEEYCLEEYGTIGGAFITGIAFRLIQPDLSKKEDVEKMEYINKHPEEKLQEYRQLVSKKLTELMFQLDEMTIYYDGEIPDNMKVRESRFHFVQDNGESR